MGFSANMSQFAWFAIIISRVLIESANIDCGVNDTLNSTTSISSICQSKTVICPDDEDCHINCKLDNSCASTTILCPQNNECIINCLGKSSCSNIEINSTHSSGLQLTCDNEDDVCTNSNIYCPTDPTSSCIISGSNDGGLDNSNIYAVHGFKHVTFDIDYNITNIFMHCSSEYDICCRINDVYPFNTCKHGNIQCQIDKESDSSLVLTVNNTIRDDINNSNHHNENISKPDPSNSDEVIISTADVGMLYLLIMILMILFCILIALVSVLLVCAYYVEKNNTKKLLDEALHEKSIRSRSRSNQSKSVQSRQSPAAVSPISKSFDVHSDVAKQWYFSPKISYTKGDKRAHTVCIATLGAKAKDDDVESSYVNSMAEQQQKSNAAALRNNIYDDNKFDEIVTAVPPPPGSPPKLMCEDTLKSKSKSFFD